MATAGAFHDIAREEEGIDYWDTESSEALEKLLSHLNKDERQARDYVQPIKEKDPLNGDLLQMSSVLFMMQIV